MAIEGNSQKAKREQTQEPAPDNSERTLKPVADGKITKRKEGFLEKWFKQDGGNIKDFLIETILIPGLIDGISGIGDILIDSFTEGVSQVFENKGFLAKSGKSKSGHTSYNEISKKKRRSRYDDEDDDEDDDGRSYDNVRVRTEREAKQVIAELRDLIADREYGYATVANLYELTDNMVTYTDHRYGWTSLNSATYVRTRNREKPWLLKLPRPKDLSDIK